MSLKLAEALCECPFDLHSYVYAQGGADGRSGGCGCGLMSCVQECCTFMFGVQRTRRDTHDQGTHTPAVPIFCAECMLQLFALELEYHCSSLLAISLLVKFQVSECRSGPDKLKTAGW